MANNSINFVKRSQIPIPIKGKAATAPYIAITEKGQLALNSIATKMLGDKKKVGIGFDRDTHELVLFIQGSSVIAKVPEEELFTLSRGKDGKGRNAFMTATGVLKSKDVFGDYPLYDFGASGGQTFPATFDDKKLTLRFAMPSGVLPRKPTTARKKRGANKAAAASTTPATTTGSVTVGKTNGAPVEVHATPAPAEDDLLLS